MLQLVALLLISWGLLHFIERKNLSVLGFKPAPGLLKIVVLVFIISAASATLAYLLRMYVAGEQYVLSDEITPLMVLQEFGNQIRTVLTEELICRGAILYILIRRLGNTKAIVLSALLFASLHFMNPAIWSNVVQAGLLFIFTFTMGLLLGYAYARTYSILIPFAIHFGWNLFQNFVFAETTEGVHLFVLAGPPPEVTVSYLAFFTMLLLPKCMVLGANGLVVRRIKPVAAP